MFQILGLIIVTCVTYASVISGAIIDDIISKSWAISDAQITYIQQTICTQNHLIAPTQIPLTLALIGHNGPAKSKSEWQQKIGIRSRRQSENSRAIALLQSLVDDPALQPVYTTRTKISGPHAIQSNALTAFGIFTPPDSNLTPSPTITQVNQVIANWKADGIALGTELRWFQGLTQGRNYPMQLIVANVSIAQTPVAKGIVIPIGNGRLELVIVVPTTWNPKLLPMDWLSPTSPVDFTNQWVVIGIPAIQFTADTDLTDALVQTGFGKWIGPNAKGGIASIRQQNELSIQFQPIPPKTAPTNTRVPFLVDRPFLYAIRDGLSGICILVGTVVDL